MTRKLTVQRLPNDDHWKDMARVPWTHRMDARGRAIRPPTICKIRVGNRSKRLSVRGWDETEEAVILLDRTTRLDLGVQLGAAYEVELRPVTVIGSWIWACCSADPAYRFPAQISIVSLILGVVALVVSFIK